MPYARLCQNPLCNKPFRAQKPWIKCCSRHCDAVLRPPKPLAVRFWAKVRQCVHGDLCPYCCCEWTASTNKAGYGLFSVKEGTKWVTRLAHTVGWELVNERPVPDGLQINHHCDNPPCCSPWHIYTGTHGQNALDAQRRGRLAVGEARSRLTNADVLLMRELYRQGTPVLPLAEQFHIGESTVFTILSGRSWKHLPGALSPEELHALVLPRRQMVSRTRPRTVLTEDKAREIRVLAKTGMQRAVLAQQFGVSLSTIKAILIRRLWKDA